MDKKKPDIVVIKASEEQEVFSSTKLKSSLKNAGASSKLIDFVINETEKILYQNITTKDIYKKAFSLLQRKSRVDAAKYKLKQAIMELGPTGYPFENFVGELLKHQGYKVKVGVLVQGNCVQHEVDVVAEKENKHFMIECKYHKSFNTKCHVKNPLYIHSRFLDVEKQWLKREGHSHKFHQGWLVNNTRFSKDAIQYGNCAGLKLLGWDYPSNGSLKEQISISGLYPITCLFSLTKREKQSLLEKNIVLCKQLCEDVNQLDSIISEPNKKKRIIEEAHKLCNPLN